MSILDAQPDPSDLRESLYHNHHTSDQLEHLVSVDQLRMTDNQIRLLKEDIWCFHKCMDEAGVPREDNEGELSLFGRALAFAQMKKEAL